MLPDWYKEYAGNYKSASDYEDVVRKIKLALKDHKLLGGAFLFLEMGWAIGVPSEVFHDAWEYGWTHNKDTRNLRITLQQLVGEDKPFDERDWL